MSTFIAFLHRNDDGSYTVEFPDLPGCGCTGDNAGIVSALAGDDLGRHLTNLMNFGYPLPNPSSETQLAADPRRGSAELMAFDIDLDLLSIPNPLTYHTL